jgi:capsular exopolysaccharide synthesis family protein
MDAIYGMDEPTTRRSLESEIFAKLWRRKALIVTAGVLLFLILALAVQFLPKHYKAISSVSVEQTPKAVATGNVVPETPFNDVTIGTELALLKSRELMTETVQRTGLLRNAEFNPHLNSSLLTWLDRATDHCCIGRWLPYATGWLPSEGPLDTTAAERQLADTVSTLAKHVQFVPEPRSRVIDIVVSSRDNGLAARIANTIADLYISDHLTYRQDMDKAAHDFVAQRVQELKASAATAADAAVKFQVANGLTITSSRDNSTIIQEQASAVNAQLETAKNRLATLQAQYAGDSKADPETLAAALGSQTIARLREQEAQAMADRAKFAASYGSNSPVVAPFNIRLATIKSQIHAEAVRAVQALPNQIGAAQEEVRALSQRLNELRSQMANMDKARAELALLNVESTAQNNIYREFLERATQTDTSVLFPATPVRVVSRAVPPVRAAFPDNKLMLPAAGFVAFLLSSCLALFIERGKGLVSSSEVETMLGIPALAMLPVRTAKTDEMYQDGIEDLLNRLLYEHDATSVLLTSALPGEGKSTTARALVHAAAQRGLNALLIEADLRSSYARTKRTNSALGLSDVLRGEIEVGDATSRPSDGLAILPSGQARGNPSRLLANPRLKHAMEAVKGKYDFVVVDAPPALIGGDTWSLSKHVDCTVLLAHWDHTEPQHVALAIKQLIMPASDRATQGVQAGATLAGLVLNMVDPSRCMKLGNADSIRFSAAMFRYYRQ